MSVEVAGGARPTSMPSKVCPLPFSGNRGPLHGRSPYDVTPDGQRVVLVEGAITSDVSPIMVLVNWPAKLSPQ
jgi:hypothetical protein